MSQPVRWTVSWTTADGRLEAREPSPAEVAAAAPQLSAWYNEAHNRSMMANEQAMDTGDVREHFDSLWRAGGRAFLLYAGEHLMGDADLRHIDDGRHTAEIAIMVGEREVQGRGYGTRFALMLHALAFRELALERIYASIIPANHASLRLFDKLGYQRDGSPAARAYIDADSDITMSFAREDFERRYAELLPDFKLAPCRAG